MLYVPCNLHNAKKEGVIPLLVLSGSNPTDNKSNYEDNCGKRPTNPNGSKHPNPRPVDNFTQLENNKGDTEKSREARKVNIDSLIFHDNVPSGLEEFSFSYVLIIS